MARPKTEGLEYFPKDTGSFSDRKIRRLMKEFGCKGYVIYDYLRCVIYEDKGYYVAYDDGLAFDVADFLGDGISENLVDEVVKGCLRNDLFDCKLYDTYLILTSNGIQKRYSLIKKGGVIDEKYRVIADEDDETTENDHLIPQRKVKKTKVKESKENNNKENSAELTVEFLTTEFDNATEWHYVLKRDLGITPEARINHFKEFFKEIEGTREFLNYADFQAAQKHFYFWFKKCKEKSKSVSNNNHSGIEAN